MKTVTFTIMFFTILLFGCSTGGAEDKNSNVKMPVKIVEIEVDKSELKLNGNEGNWYHNQELFNGFLVSHDEAGNLVQKVGFYNGKKEGIAKLWFSNGQLKVESNYHRNKLVNSYKSWWPNGVLANESTYKNGKLQGVEKRWYASEQLAKQMTYNNGKEEGMQKAWLKNGKLYVNYEAKNGRIFGMRKANLCYQLEDEEVVDDARSQSIFGDLKKKE